VFRGIVIDPPRLVEDALHFVVEFNEANPRRQSRSTTNQVLNHPLFSLYVDAGCFSNGSTGWGVAVHD